MMQSLSTTQVQTQQEHSELSELMGDFGLENAKGKGIAADHAIEQQFAQSEHDLKQANERVTAVNDAIRELQHLEDFIRSTKPPREEAAMLTEEIVRQLVEKVNFLRLDFPAQAAPKPVSPFVCLPQTLPQVSKLYLVCKSSNDMLKRRVTSTVPVAVGQQAR